MNIVFMSMDTLPSTLWARDLYDQMHIRSDFRKWFRVCASMVSSRAATTSICPVSGSRMRADVRSSGM